MIVMRWMENIRLRVSQNARTDVQKKIRAFEKGMKHSTKLQAWQVYCHAVISGDFSISLYWDTDQPEKDGSVLAYNLVKMLSTSGVVDHSVWIAKTHFDEA